jgi:hypothetical protein
MNKYRCLGTKWQLIAGLFFLGGSVNVHAQAPNACSATNNADAKIAAVQAEYEQKFKAHQDSVKQRADRIKDETPTPSTTEAALNGTIEFRPHLREFQFAVPQVTMASQKMAMHVPQVTSNTKTWSTDVPTVTMEMQCLPGPPEIVIEWAMCTVGFVKTKCNPKSTIRPGKDICTKVPKSHMERKEAKFNVPEVKMGRADWTISLPQFKMATQTIKFNIPDIVVSDVKGDLRQSQKDAEQLSATAEKETGDLSAAMTTEIKSITTEMISSTFACQARELDSKMKEASDQIAAQETGIVASLNYAREIKATDLINSYEAALKELSAIKTQMAKDHSDARKRLFDEEKAAVAQALM